MKFRPRPAASLILAATAITALAGCAATSSTARTPVPDPAASAAFSSVAAARSSAAAAIASAASSAATAPCTTRSCIASDAEQSLRGGIAQDKAVALKAACRKSTVVRHAGDIWTVRCTVDYTDGSQSSGVATLLLDRNQITFQPTA